MNPSSIYLVQREGAWVACHRGANARTMIDLFGSADVPTAYLASANAETVGADIASLNPGVFVYTVEGEKVLDWTASAAISR